MAAVYGLVLVCIELLLNTFALELSVATLTDAKNGHAVGSYYDPELAFGQLAVQRIGQGGRNACGNQMVPLPTSLLWLVCQKDFGSKNSACHSRLVIQGVVQKTGSIQICVQLVLSGQAFRARHGTNQAFQGMPNGASSARSIVALPRAGNA